MKITQTYDEAKDKLISLYNQLLQSELMEGMDSIPDNIGQLENQKFIVSICGEIKTGKSTLINYLLFDGDEILPIDATPETARLAKILYGKEEKVIVHFLNQSEWAKFENVLKNNPDLKNEWNEVEYKLNNLQKIGIYLKDLVKEITYSKMIKIEELGDYVSKDSDYVPMVSFAEVYKNNPILDKVMVVDTPGLNDPCNARSEVTNHWAAKTDALIYMMRSDQALSKTDLHFLDQYCSHLNPDKLILAISKIDHKDYYDDIIAYVESVLNSHQFKNRMYLENRKPFPISVISAMLKNCSEKVEHKDECLGKIDPKLIEKEGCLPEFIKAVSESLMQSKGSDIINSHKSKLISILDLNLEVVQLNMNTLKDRQDNYNKSYEEMLEKKKHTETLNQKLNKMIGGMKTGKLENDIKDVVYKYFDGPGRQSTIEHILSYISSKDFDHLVPNLQYVIKNRVRNDIVSFLDNHWDNNLTITRGIDSLNAQINEFYRECERQHPDLVTFRDSIHRPNISYVKIRGRLDILTDEYLKKDEFEKARKEFWDFLWTVEKKSKENLQGVVKDQLDIVYKNLQENISNEPVKVLHDHKVDILHRMSNVLDIIGSNLEKISIDEKRRKQEIMKIEQDLQKLKDAKKRVSQLKTEIESKLSLVKGA